MPNQQIDKHLVIQFSELVHVKAQQMQARLRRVGVPMTNLTADKYAYDGLGQVEAREITGRNVPVVFADMEHNRRKLRRRRFEVTLPIDASDVRGSLIAMQQQYAAANVRAMARVFDRVGIEALFADVSTGRDFETDVTFANDGGNTVTATSGLTYEKLLETETFFINNEVGTDDLEPMVLGITGDEHSDLMKETELISGDFSRQFVIDKGQITRALGFEVLKWGASVTNPLLNVASSVRSCFAMVPRALFYGMALDMSLKIQERVDLVETSQVQIVTELGAVRTEGVLLQKVTTTPA